MRDLDEVLAQAEDEYGSSLRGRAMSEDSLAVLTGRIRARRARRRVLQAAVVVPMAAALVWGAVAVRDVVRAPAPFATQPVPTSPSSATPTSPTGTDRAVPLPDEPGLPARLALSADVLATTGPGWVLATYMPVPGSSVPTAADQTVVVLSSPQGLVYEVARLAAQATAPTGEWNAYQVVDWRPGEASALVAEAAIPTVTAGTTFDALPHEYATLDLLTGTLGARRPEYSGLLLDEVRGDVRLWHDPSSGEVMVDSGGPLRVVGQDPNRGRPLLSPDGRLVMAGDAVVETSTGAVVGTLSATSAAGRCSPVSWWTADSVLAECTTGDPSGFDGPYLDLRPTLVAFDPAALTSGVGTTVTALRAGDPVLWSPSPSAWLADGEIAAPGTVLTAGGGLLGDVCSDGVYLLRDGSFTRLASSDTRSTVNSYRAQAVAGHVVVESSLGCLGGQTPAVLTRVDLATGTATQLIGLPDEPAPGDGRPLTTLTSWVLGR